MEIVYGESQKRVGGWVEGGGRAGGTEMAAGWSSSSERRCNEVSLAFSVPKLSESV